MLRLSRLFILVLAVLVACAGTAQAAFPERPITMIVPFGAGGSNDLPARVLAGMMEKKLGQPVIVQNVVGAGGTQGTTQIAQARPDGYTIGFDPTGALCLQPHMKKLPYGVDSFQFIGMATQQPVVLMTGKNAPWKNIEGMVAMVRKNPGKYIVGITGQGNMSHVPVIALAKHYNLKFRYVPYRSTPEVMKEIAAGRLHFHADMPVALAQYEVYGLVQFSDRKVANLNMPNSADIGLNKNFIMWQACIAPRGIPADVLKVLVDTMREVVNSPEYAEAIQRLSMNVWWMEPDEAQAFYAKEFVSYGEALKEALKK